MLNDVMSSEEFAKWAIHDTLTYEEEERARKEAEASRR